MQDPDPVFEPQLRAVSVGPRRGAATNYIPKTLFFPFQHYNHG